MAKDLNKVAAVAQVQYLSVLLDDRHMPALLVTADTQGSVLQLQRLNEVREGREDSMQLWALDGDKPPRSLGVIASTYKTLQLPAPATALAGVQELAISVEDKGGAAVGRGPNRSPPSSRPPWPSSRRSLRMPRPPATPTRPPM